MNKQLARTLLRTIIGLRLSLAQRIFLDRDSGEALFRHTWNALRDHPLIAWCAVRTRQRFRPDARESLLFELLTVMRARGIPFEPDMQLQAPTTIQTLLDQGRLPLIVVTNHTGFRATTRSLLRNGLPVTLVTDTLPPEELTRRYRSILEKYPKFSMVPKDRYCLAALRKAL